MSNRADGQSTLSQEIAFLLSATKEPRQRDRQPRDYDADKHIAGSAMRDGKGNAAKRTLDPWCIDRKEAGPLARLCFHSFVGCLFRRLPAQPYA